MIPFHGRAIHLPDAVQASHRIGVVANHIAQADIIHDTLPHRISKNRFESLKVRVYVTKNCSPH